jgi:hypothetical protein
LHIIQLLQLILTETIHKSPNVYYLHISLLWRNWGAVWIPAIADHHSDAASHTLWRRKVAPHSVAKILKSLLCRIPWLPNSLHQPNIVQKSCGNGSVWRGSWRPATKHPLFAHRYKVLSPQPLAIFAKWNRKVENSRELLGSLYLYKRPFVRLLDFSLNSRDCHINRLIMKTMDGDWIVEVWKHWTLYGKSWFTYPSPPWNGFPYASQVGHLAQVTINLRRLIS